MRNIKVALLRLIVFSFAFISTHVKAAELYLRTDGINCYETIYLVGKIEADDYRKLMLGLSAAKKKSAADKCSTATITLNVNSEGGDVDTALALGRAIRSNELKVTLGRGQRCYSACVYLLAGGVDRLIFGEVGIHRLYFADLASGMSTAQIKQKMDIWDSKITSYLNEMNVSVALYQDAKSIAPENMKILNDHDLQRYRIEGEDAAYNEKRTKEKAEMYNISMAEYRRRDNMINAVCGGYSDVICNYSVYLGISRDIIKIRFERFLRECRNSNTVSEFRKCEKKVMTEGR